jgi:hypothetical protein
MKLTKKQAEEVWQIVEVNFGWQKVHKAMKAVDWRWCNSRDREYEVPNLKRMKVHVKEWVIRACLNWKPGCKGGSGGFTIRRKKRGVAVRFDFERCFASVENE